MKNDDQQHTGPVSLEPIFVERIWGEQKLSPWYPQPEAGKPIGEAWLTAKECVEENSTFTLAQLAKASPDGFGNESGEGFPLLIKVLYPREKLSVQVHPDDEQARATLDQPRGKTECWYVLSAEPGAQVAVGFREPITTEEMKASIENGSIEEKLRYIPVKAGDMVFVDAGTVHAIGPGIVALETQQYSDTTYRLWDYGRPRELHLEAGLAVARANTAAGLVEPTEMEGFTRLVSCPYFKVDSFKSQGGKALSLGESDSLQILIALGEGAFLLSQNGYSELKPGRAVVIPAEGEEYKIHSSDTVEVVRVLR